MPNKQSLKSRIYHILSVSKKSGNLSWWFDICLILLILLNVLAIILESMEGLRSEYQTLFNRFEFISVAIFSIEYVLRLWTITEHDSYKRVFSGRIRYALSPMALIDLFSILPAYLPLLGVDLRLLRLARIFRIFRLLKLARYIHALRLIQKVFTSKREELLISLVFTLFMLLVTSTLMYYVENAAQPDNFSSIPETMWWGIATLTTVGYGDIYPITALGKFLGGAIAILGIGIFALPAGILASGFSDQLSSDRAADLVCPHCGKHHS